MLSARGFPLRARGKMKILQIVPRIFEHLVMPDGKILAFFIQLVNIFQKSQNVS